MVRKSRKTKKQIFKNVREYFSQVGKVRNSIFSLSLSLRWDGGMGFPALAPNGYENASLNGILYTQVVEHLRGLQESIQSSDVANSILVTKT